MCWQVHANLSSTSENEAGRRRRRVVSKEIVNTGRMLHEIAVIGVALFFPLVVLLVLTGH